LRIISGKYKGKTIVPDRNFSARPTTDFAKEGLFNVLVNYFDFEQVKVLDLFSGTGSISYEFASRGALGVDLVELDPKHFAFIRKTALDLGFKQIHPIRSSVLQFLRSCHTQYHIIFADPPFDLHNISDIPDAVLSQNILLPEGWLIVEHSRKTDFSKHPCFFDFRHYGSVCFSFFRQATINA
jgi:16S rRNA (guanine966-N2)-methyltransferase